MSLSEQQMKIVHHPVDRHAVVLAVAGSGKSTTMAERIAYLVEAKRVDPAHVLAVMFNSGAAEELGKKLEKRLGKRNAPASMTYHRLGTLSLNRLVRAGLAEDWDFEASTYKANYFAVNAIEDYCRKYQHKYPRLVADAFLGFVDRTKSDLSTPAETWELGDWNANYAWFVEAYPLYESLRRKRKKRFFSDLIYDPVMAMLGSDKAASCIANRYAHIVVDEYQDICESQQALVRFNAGQRARVMVVGDDDQTIYAWRGAKPSYILSDFYKDFPDADTYLLTRTWRYGHALSCAANYVITANENRADKLCISGEAAPNTDIEVMWEQRSESRPNLNGYRSDFERVSEVDEHECDIDHELTTKAVENWLEKGGKLSDIAILVRAYSRSARAQFALLNKGIPFRLDGGDSVSVLSNKWVACLLGWLDLVAGNMAAHPYVGEPEFGYIAAVRKVLNVPVLGLQHESTQTLCKMVLNEPDGLGAFIGFIKTLAVSNGILAESIFKRGQLWKEVRSLAPRQAEIDVHDFIKKIIDRLELAKEIRKAAKSVDEAEDELEILGAFMAYLKLNAQGRTPRQFMAHINDLRTVSERAKASTEAVHMTSIHRSKGLEWPCVIMIALIDGYFPLKPKKQLNDDQLEAHLEDERRLFYVGMTRAKNKLVLISPDDAMLLQWWRAGRSGYPEEHEPGGVMASRFLYESNIFLSKTMPVMLKRDLKISAVGPEVYNAYLSELALPRAVAKLPARE